MENFSTVNQASPPLSPPPLSDRDLIATIQGGDASTFHHLVAKYETRVFNHCYRLVGDWDESADLTQEVFFKVFRYIGKYEHTYAFYTWLYRITVNCCIDFIRDRRRRHTKLPLAVPEQNYPADSWREPEIPDDTLGPEKYMDGMELNDVLHDALSRIPSGLRSIIVMKEVEGLSYSEIAEISKCSLGTVKSRMHRARGQLREILEPYVTGASA